MAAQLHAPIDADQRQEFLINWNAGPLGVVLRPDAGHDASPVVAQLLPQPSVVKMAGVREGDVLISVNGTKTTHLGYEKVVRLLFKERLPMILHFRSPRSGRGRGRARSSSSTRNRATSRVPMLEEECYPKVPVEDKVSSSSRTKKREKKKKKEGTKTKGDDDVDEDNDDVRHKSRSTETGERRRQRKQYSVVWERGSLGLSFRAYSSSVNVPCVDFISASRGQGRGMDRICVNDVLVAINGEKTKALGVEKVLRWLHVVDKPVVLRFYASSNRVVLDSAHGLYADPFDAPYDETLMMQKRRLAVPQPEGEPAPRPPRRNNSVDHVVPAHYKTDRGPFCRSEDELQRSKGPRQYLRDYTTQFETQSPSEAQESPKYSRAFEIQAKQRRHSYGLISDYAGDRELVYEENDKVDIFDREPPMRARQFDVKSDARMMSHRHRQQEDAGRFYELNQAQLPPTRTRARSSAAQQQRALPESKSARSKVTVSAGAARPRLASHDSQVSNSSQMSFDEAAGVVARATGKSVKECKFGGVPVLDIKEGTVQSKLMYIYAKACLAMENKSDNQDALGDHEPLRTSRHPVSRKTHPNFLSYTILQDDAVVSKYKEKNRGTSSRAVVKQKEKHKAESTNEMDCSITPGVTDHRPDKRMWTMQKDIDITVSPVADRPHSSVDPSCLTVIDAATSTLPPQAHATPTDDFISLSDFAVQDGRVVERRPTLGFSSIADTPVPSAVGGDAEKSEGQQEELSAVDETDVKCIARINAESIEGCATVESKLTKPPHDASDDGHQQKDRVAVDQRMESHEMMTDVPGGEQNGTNVHEYTDEMQKGAAREHKNGHEDDDFASIGGSNERGLAAGVASLDGLLDFSLNDGSHDNEECVYADAGYGVSERTGAGEIEPASTSLITKLGFDHARKVSKTNDNGDDEAFDERGKHNENGEYEENDVDAGVEALSDPLVSTLFHNHPDVCEVIKDKPACAVLVKKSMIDEIQEILQSLQMEVHFERHSTTAFGSTASPSRSLPHSCDTDGQHCYRCGTTCELVELDIARGQRELYCPECCEMFFFSEDCQSPVARSSKVLQGADRLTADTDAPAEVVRFDDSSVTSGDIVNPWRYNLQRSDTSSSTRGSDTPSMTKPVDEVWL
ncbi:unnamed protein product [Hyaloperonospora brassicae]|uniref:PDZ domain-containing protein n=1 Tax=Hyaloperonospora brassicae TaxID=162125 RepID=A0AAV0V3S4_HYABA|nr:unnamed protein product [Hyaloperonospora brassicae]